MKKPTKKPARPETVRRPLNTSELAQVGGGGGEVTSKTGSNGTGLVADWETPTA